MTKKKIRKIKYFCFLSGQETNPLQGGGDNDQGQADNTHSCNEECTHFASHNNFGNFKANVGRRVSAERYHSGMTYAELRSESFCGDDANVENLEYFEVIVTLYPVF